MNLKRLSVLSLVLFGCSKTSHGPSPAVSAVAEPINAPAADGGSPPSQAKTPPQTRLPLRVVATAAWGARLHRLPSGDLLYSHEFTIRKLGADGSMTRLLRVDPGKGFATETTPIGAITGDLDADLYLSLSEGDHRAGHTSRMMRVTGSKVTPLVDKSSWLYLDSAHGPEGRLLGLRATGAVRFEFNSVPWIVDGVEVVRGAPAPMPVLPKGFFAQGFVAFESGEVFLAGGKGDFAMGALGGYVLHSTPKDPKGTLTALPDIDPEKVGVYSIAARNDHEVYVGGIGAQDHGYLARWDGTAWKALTTASPKRFFGLSIGKDGTVFALDDTPELGASLYRGTFDGGFEEIALPDAFDIHYATPAPPLIYQSSGITTYEREKRNATNQTPLRAVQVIANAKDDVWVLATRDAPGGLLTYLLHTQATESALDADVEESTFDTTQENEQPAPPAGAKCATTFGSLGEPNDTTLARFREANEKNKEVHFGPLVQGTLHGERVAGVYLAGQGDFVTKFTASMRAAGLAPKLVCRRPVLEKVLAE